ncbi:MAG: metallophosphoesterase family protein [Peptostreptococcaceae bacterium]
MKIGVISDTHGLLRSEVKSNLSDCDLIIHAGDIGKMEIIKDLNKIANCEYIKGNCDKSIEFNDVSEFKIIEINKIKIYIIHDIRNIDKDLKSIGINIVIYGHSHKKEFYKKDGILYINPGSVGPRRFKLPTTMNKIEINDENIENIKLDYIEI